VANYEDLKNKQNELIRKSLEGSVFLGDISVPAITSLTVFSATATTAEVAGSAAAAATVTDGGVLSVKVNGELHTITVADGDAKAAVATALQTAVGAGDVTVTATGAFTITTVATGSSAKVEVVALGGSIANDLHLSVGQRSVGYDVGINLKLLPQGMDDLGWLSTDGAQFSRDVSTSDVQSWGSVTPTRSDVTSDTSTMAVTAQETKLLTIGLATGADLASMVPDSQTGEVSIAKPTRPAGKHYRALSVAVDIGDGGEIYLARFFPRGKVTNYAEQNHGGGDDPVSWGVTLTGEEDSNLGYSERWLFGGPGWNAILADMGFPTA
jgi:hypothetical protein